MCICMLFSYNRTQSVIFRHEKNNYSIYYMSKYMYINGVFFLGGGVLCPFKNSSAILMCISCSMYCNFYILKV